MSNVPENQQLKAALQAVVDHYIANDAEVGVLMCQELFSDPNGEFATVLREHQGIEVVQLAGYLEAQQRVANNSESQQPSISEIRGAAEFLDSQPCNNSAAQPLSNSARQQVADAAVQQLNNLMRQQFRVSATQQPEQSARDLLRELDELSALLGETNQTIGERVETENRYREVIAQIGPLREFVTQQLSNPATQQPSNSITWLRDQPASQMLEDALAAIQPFSNSATQQPEQPNTYYVEPTAKTTVKPTEAVLAWCAENGWSDPYWVPENNCWWGFQGQAIMAVALPRVAQTGKFDPVAPQLSPVGIGNLHTSELFSQLHDFLLEYERRNFSQPRLGVSSLVDYFDYTLELLRPSERVRLVHWSMIRDYREATLHMGFAALHRVDVNPRAIISNDVMICELFLQPARLERELADTHTLAAFLLDRSLEILRVLGQSPHPRWFVGTTDQSNRGFGREIPTTEINQCVHYLSGPQRRFYD